MNVERTTIPDVLVIRPEVYGDDRGFFFEAFNLEAFEAATGVVRNWVQDNHSRSVHGVLRGLHFQNPKAQGKLVRCASGRVFDVVVDVRRSSGTFLEWTGIELSEQNRLQLWVPEGFAHGFLTLSESADLIYKATDYYDREADQSMRWNDPAIGIDWPLDDTMPLLSEKDAGAPLAEDAHLYE